MMLSSHTHPLAEELEQAEWWACWNKSLPVTAHTRCPLVDFKRAYWTLTSTGPRSGQLPPPLWVTPPCCQNPEAHCISWLFYLHSEIITEHSIWAPSAALSRQEIVHLCTCINTSCDWPRKQKPMLCRNPLISRNFTNIATESSAKLKAALCFRGLVYLPLSSAPRGGWVWRCSVCCSSPPCCLPTLLMGASPCCFNLNRLYFALIVHSLSSANISLFYPQ